MGQYYNIVNVDKKEIIPSQLDTNHWFGTKLVEFCYEGNERINALEAILDAKNGKWRGDHVYIVDDYADDSHFDIPRKAYQQALALIPNSIKEKDDFSLYDLSNCKEINPSPYKGRHYIYNLAKKVETVK
ncbi:hypothetical protein KQ229_08220 [Lactobacillus helveticus]|uniref:Uncharacterized protein n=2 Tax=Lactobacillus helveticus TaxID=1587 RepID=A0AAV4E2J9_LACHE|nr:hypothetical protein [Lactobacillus helveticus]AKG66546.1 hypothetical protein TU99_04160 [Lactobacillus helveticus]ANZ55170.1 hypothetical protein BCM45_00580 [Lactobacillus helveticus]AQY53269.1 hypothetical protein BCM44_03750 [Lactobacillus helveticus]KXN78203.1 hypothetical protein AY471_10430 [Lactobacillus helveticus]MBU5981467.1 hypothetical protein [Lactobacillus helveticus]